MTKNRGCLKMFQAAYYTKTSGKVIWIVDLQELGGENELY